MVQYVIIGNGVAGVRCAEAIRKHDSSGNMVMISEEGFPFYYKPFLPEYVAGLVTEERLWAKPKDFYIHHKIDLKLGQKVTKVLPDDKLVCLENGKNIPFDTLLIATGGSPVPFRCPGSDADGVGYLKTLADAKKLREKVPAASTGVIMGTGILGLELVDTFIKCGLTTHYLLPGDNIWPAVLDKEASALIENSLSKKGVRLYKRAKIRRIGTEENKVKEVLLDTGEAISCQLVGVAIGLRPNTDMVRWSGIQIRGMIFVNRKMETNIPKIFAAGDVALCYEIPGEASRCLPRWYRAWKQGEVAGLNMVGIGTEYQEMPICETSTKIADIPLLCLGNPNPSESDVKIFSGKDQDKGIYKKIALKDNQIEGALLIGDVGGAAKLSQLMNKGQSVTDSEQTLLEELVSVSGAEPVRASNICPICKTEINSGGCPACSQ